MKRVLVDSNIFLDYYLDRRDNLLPLGEFAFQFIRKAVECRYLVLITKDVLFEIKNVLALNEEAVWKTVFGSLKKKNKIELFEYSKEIEQKAIALAKKENIPKTDALLLEAAKENNLPLVSRNFHLHKSKAVEVFKPEEMD